MPQKRGMDRARGEEGLLDRLLAVLWKLTHAPALQKLERRKRV